MLVLIVPVPRHEYRVRGTAVVSGPVHLTRYHNLHAIYVDVLFSRRAVYKQVVRGVASFTTTSRSTPLTKSLGMFSSSQRID